VTDLILPLHLDPRVKIASGNVFRCRFQPLERSQDVQGDGNGKQDTQEETQTGKNSRNVHRFHTPEIDFLDPLVNEAIRPFLPAPEDIDECIDDGSRFPLPPVASPLPDFLPG